MGAAGLIVSDVSRGGVRCRGVIPQRSMRRAESGRFMGYMANLTGILIGIRFATPDEGCYSHRAIGARASR